MKPTNSQHTSLHTPPKNDIPAPINDTLKSMIRVNQAGEYGATRIYAGQLAILKGTPVGETLTEMATQEKEHLQKFNRMIIEHQVRPTLLQPLWHVGGYALGMLTAMMGEKAAHACTIAVEEVIDEHYQGQLEELNASPASSSHAPLANLIEACRQDELAHKETAIELGGRDAPAYELLTTAVKTISRTAIWLSSRI
ncbi:MAG: demethoxyubiquinone hydroxylase family protein [Alphaproteobacteria bacterium]|jgi:ubiquinone biosynthesis monooxygenase Coq7|nr:demethoxyubiquinone hydroxylase family protein [Alphaproteobacteria bacterium]